MKGARHPLFINIQAHFHQEFYVELAEALTLDYWTQDWTKSFYLKLDFLNCNTLQALMLDSHTLTLVHCKHNTYSPNTLAHTSLLDTHTH